MKEQVLEFLELNYPEDRVIQMVDEEIASGDWIDEDWNDEHETEYDWYQDFGRGEAENSIRTQIIDELIKKIGFTYKSYNEEVGEEIYETINNIYEILDK